MITVCLTVSLRHTPRLTTIGALLVCLITYAICNALVPSTLARSYLVMYGVVTRLRGAPSSS